jgi:transposase
MVSYAGLDVSQQETQLCVLDERGLVRWTGKVATEPGAVAAVLRRRAPDLERAVLESGALSGWLCCGLQDAGLPVLCIDARAAHGALKGRSKTDRSDAEGLGRLAQVGWFKMVRVKSRESQERRALLVARERLVRVQRDLVNQVRGLLKTAGRILPRTTPRRLALRIQTMLDGSPGLRPAILPLLAARAAVAAELERLDRTIVRAAAADPACRRLATIPGVGAITAMSFTAVIDDPGRFTRPDQAAAYLGLTPRRWQSGEVDYTGRISKSGNAMMRHLLYEAANALLTRLKRACALKAWGLQLQARVGGKKARVALARRLAVLMHRLWTREVDFDWQRGLATP